MQRISCFSNEDYQGLDYSNLISHFLGKADTFQVVLRTDIAFHSQDASYNPSAYQLIRELDSFIFEGKCSTRWMAGATSGSIALVYRGRFNEESLSILLKHTNKISDWQGPDKPEDLSLMLGNRPCLSFIGHEAISRYYFDAEALIQVKEKSINKESISFYLAGNQRLRFDQCVDEEELLDQADKFISDCDYQGEVYERLLKNFLNYADTFEIAIKTGIHGLDGEMYRYDDSAYQLIQALASFLFEEKRGPGWAEWSIYDAPDLIYRGKFNEDSLKILLKYTNKISDWGGPSRPESLSLTQGNAPRLHFLCNETLQEFGKEVKSVYYLTPDEFESLTAQGLGDEMEPSAF